MEIKKPAAMASLLPVELEDMDEVFIIILNRFSIDSNSYYNDY